MKITNQTFTAQPLKLTKNLKPEEKFQAEKTNDTSQMSQAEEMAAFKKDFYNEISQITTHQSVSNMAVNVSDKAFEAMKADPAYKEQVISLIKRDCQGSYAPRDCSLAISVGAAIDEYRADSWPVGFDSEFDIRSQNSFYSSSKKKSQEDDEIRARYTQQRLQSLRLQKALDIKKQAVSDKLEEELLQNQMQLKSLAAGI